VYVEQVFVMTHQRISVVQGITCFPRPNRVNIYITYTYTYNIHIDVHIYIVFYLFVSIINNVTDRE